MTRLWVPGHGPDIVMGVYLRLCDFDLSVSMSQDVRSVLLGRVFPRI